MDLMTRRSVLLASGKKVIDTSPKIAEYGVCWNRTQGGKTASDNWCITEWYDFNPLYHGTMYINGYVGSDNAFITFQYEGLYDNGNTYKNWYYFIGQSRVLGEQTITMQRITFSIQIEQIDNAYAYIQETGQIIFAGKNSPYYGYTNINDMPSA